MRDLRVRPKILNFILVFSKPNLQIFRFIGTDIPSDSQKMAFISQANNTISDLQEKLLFFVG